MASINPQITLTGLARRLVNDNVLAENVAEKANEEAHRKKKDFVRYLVENDLAKADAIAWAAAQEFGIPYFDLSTLELDNETIKLVDEKLITKHHALPLFRRGNRLFVAISSPTNLDALDQIKFHTGISTDAVLVEDDKLATTIETALNSQTSTMDDLLDEDLDNLTVESGEESRDDEVGDDVDEAPVVRFINKILLDAINRGASDIHFEPYEKTCRVRVRQDGILQEIAEPPVALASRMVARFKVMASMDISERRVPQDGRIKLTLSKNRSIDFRVNTLPTLFGEKVVLRILDGSAAKLGIDALGYEPEQKKLYMDAIHRPWGMILVTGPTGSGKTVSLYTALNILNTPDRNISTAEDPVEINLAGINQVHMNAKTGMTFPLALRAFLRQDPDIIMVGEIRDLETAEISIKAAQTGHLVLSTLHTNDAPQTLTRLANMGVPPFNIASSVSLIIAQRLARRLCDNCKTINTEIPEEALREEGFPEESISKGIKVYKPVGCDQCANGYKGRTGIYQVIKISEDMGRLIMDGGNAMELADQAKAEGYADLRQSGLKKIVDGITSLEEINRVTKD
ncbi:Type IV fimbrial assembly, ATPase PilB [hydrothermal vent metagenome]|uniref:Type IV fimbrial assembly, ATPase PilB n=1 Tax=hydrothermal vent metagenome TaxID=652676 RepID=A0A3B0XVH4_9ZZZZ